MTQETEKQNKIIYKRRIMNGESHESAMGGLDDFFFDTADMERGIGKKIKRRYLGEKLFSCCSRCGQRLKVIKNDEKYIYCKKCRLIFPA